MTEQITYNTPAPQPSFTDAIVNLMRALSSTFAPRSLTQRGQYLDQQIEGQGTNPTAPAPTPLTIPTPRVSLGNQSPGLGNSF